ncbi:hypothetical protein [Nocardiopsis baichengensis]|uniref:hypothetical protein n=1 Tax=Nocardiopsis baichengensis TaxID=280240 RepID=UPI00034BF2A6|nr:hypothetical protein [Nocardiopsis baichengensis]
MPDSVSRRGTTADALIRSAPTLQVLGRLIDQAGRQSGSEAVFGPAIEHDGAVVVPVARTRFFFAFGAGTSRAFRIVGDGGGGQGFSKTEPAGYLLIRGDDAEFRPVRQPAKALVLPLAAIAAMASVSIVRSAMRRKRRAETAKALAEAAQVRRHGRQDGDSPARTQEETGARA